MQQRQVSRFVMASLSVLLCSCQLLFELAGSYHDGDGTPPASTEPSIERAANSLVLSRDLVVTLTPYIGLQLIDVHDPDEPRVVSEYRTSISVNDTFYRVGDHVLVLADQIWGYRGQRTDIPVPPDAGPLLLNIDIRERAHPVLIETLPLSGQRLVDSRLRVGPGGAELHVLSTIFNDARDQDVLETLQLRNGRLRALDPIEVTGWGARIASASPKWLVIASQESGSDHTNMHSLRIDSGQPIAAASIRVPGYFSGVETPIFGDLLRVPQATPNGAGFDVHSFQLTDAALSGSCKIEAPALRDFPAPPVFLGDDLMVISARGSERSEVLRFMLGPRGECDAWTPFAAGGELLRNPSLLRSGRTLTTEYWLNEPQSLLSLYDMQESTSSGLLAQTEIDVHVAGDMQLLQRFSGDASAADGTNETGLVALPCMKPNPMFDWSDPCAQLATYSDHTLTRRANLPLYGQLMRTLALRNDRLGLLTWPELLTYDASDMDALRETSRLVLAPLYRALFRFGEHSVRIQSLDSLDPTNWLEVLPLTAAGARDPVRARIQVPNRGEWLQADDLLVNVQRLGLIVEGYPQAPSRYDIQVYDLRDPERPRVAGRLQTDEIIASHDRGEGGYGSGRIAGRALVFRHLTDDGGEAFDVVDLRDPDAPTLVRPAFSLSDGAPDLNAQFPVISGSQWWANIAVPPGPGEWMWKHYLRVVDFADPSAPQRGPRLSVPREVRLVSGSSLYAHDRRLETRATLMRLEAHGDRIDVAATFQPPWDGLVALDSLTTDSLGHIFATYVVDPPCEDCPAFRSADPATPLPPWTHLVVLDAVSLEMLSTLPLDNIAQDARYAAGRLLYDGAGVALLVDVHDPAQPRLQAYFQHNSRTRIDGEHVFSYGYGLQHWRADTESWGSSP
jgi:hypothetical protein